MSTKRKQKRYYRSAAEKEQLIMAFEGTPLGGRGEWLRSQGINSGWFNRMRQKYLAAHPELGLTESSTTTLQRIEHTPSPAALLAEYDRLERGEKGPWLKLHGINRQSIYDLRFNTKKANGSLPTVRESLPAIRVPQTIDATFTPATTLDDAILALEVKRDHYTEIINNLKAMRGSR